MKPTLNNSNGSTHKPVRLVTMLLLVFCCSGATCTRSLRHPFASYGPPAPEVLAPGASLDMVVAAVNQNASRIQNIQTNNASITVPGMTSLPLLRGNIAAERPGRIRLQASTAITGPEVDLGSNDELFWFWVKRNEPPALYFAKHCQFVGSAAQQIMPVEPQWLLDALGFAQFNPTDMHEPPVAYGGDKLEIRSVIQSRIGTITKLTVVDARRAWVLEQYVYDAQGTLLASAVARSHQYYPAVNVSLPQEIEIRMPIAQLALTIDLGTVAVNQPALNPALWEIPPMTGYQQIDLGTAPPNTLSAIGPPGSNDWNTGASPAMVGIEPSPYAAPAVSGATTAPQFTSPQVAPAAALQPSITPSQESSFPATSLPQWQTPAVSQQMPAVTTAPAMQYQLPPGGIPLE